MLRCVTPETNFNILARSNALLRCPHHMLSAMRTSLVGLMLCAAAMPASAQLTTKYAGFQLDQGGKEVPATAVFAVENGHVAMIMTGVRGGRMIYDQKADLLRVIMDADKTYFDLDKSSPNPQAMLAQMQEQMKNMPAEQRAMAEGMMKGMMGSVTVEPMTYVWTKDTDRIAGYECTHVNGMRGTDRVTEYCGSTSKDFKMSDAERKTILEMQTHLRNFLIMVKTADDGTRAFGWDTGTDGYPVLTRCWRDGTKTLELTLQSVTHDRPDKDLFELPKDYKKLDFEGMKGGRGRRGTH